MIKYNLIMNRNVAYMVYFHLVKIWRKKNHMKRMIYLFIFYNSSRSLNVSVFHYLPWQFFLLFIRLRDSIRNFYFNKGLTHVLPDICCSILRFLCSILCNCPMFGHLFLIIFYIGIRFWINVSLWSCIGFLFFIIN